MNEEIGVSINCLAFNHGKYIARALDGFLAQKTSFKFEVIVHDDASTDNTAEIIKEYAAKYPDIIKPIFEAENQFSKWRGNLNKIIRPYMRGKYVADCEGDDYWTDENKLQIQYDIMEKHPECSMCLHKVENVDMQGSPMGTFCPNREVKEGVIPAKKFLDLISDNCYFQTTSCFTRGDVWRKYIDEEPGFYKISDVGDEPMMLYFAYQGDEYYADRIMSCYRKNAEGFSNSWKKEKALIHVDKMIKMLKSFDEYSGGRFHKNCVYRIRAFEYFLACGRGDYRSMAKLKYRKFLRRDYKKKSFVYVLLKGRFPGLMKNK